MLDFDIIEKLKIRYSNYHPLLFHRSTERAKSNVDLFDILDTVPDKYPIVWCDSKRNWITSSDFYLSDDFFGERK
jgi:hypothetical protein